MPAQPDQPLFAVPASNPLYDQLAAHYDEHFEAPHRRAYDDMAWQACAALWAHGPGSPAVVVDVGCGVGRWATRLTGQGCRVIGIEPAPKMAAAARERLAAQLADGRFELHQTRVERAVLPPGQADSVIAMGSLQYADLPFALAAARDWLRPGGTLAVLVDSLVALVIELSAAGKPQEARERLRSRRGRWQVGEQWAELDLWDAAGLATLARDTGLADVEVTGLLVGASIYGRDGLHQRLRADYAATLDAEWQLSRSGPADLGKQLLLTARRPGES